MYVAIYLVLLGIAAAILIKGITGKQKGKIIGGAVLAILVIAFFWFMSFWGEMLWFRSTGYGDRFWKEVFTRVGLSALGGLIGFFGVYLLTLYAPKRKKILRIGSRVLGAYIGVRWGYFNWETILKYINSPGTGVEDPIIGKSVSFYLFSLPFYDSIYGFLTALAGVVLLTSFLGVFVQFKKGEFELEFPEGNDQETRKRYNPIFISGGFLLFCLSLGKFLDRYQLMYSTWGTISGPGWTDVHLRLPIFMVISVITLFAGLFLIVPPLRNILRNIVEKFNIPREKSGLGAVGGVAIILFGTWFVGLSIIPGAFQWLRVEPNEITFEKQYIKNNIEFTRRGFNLHEVEVKEFPVSETFNREIVKQNENLFRNIRLWDWRALDDVYKQFQEIRLYYEFSDVDIDRYTFGDMYRQVMTSARELELENLPAQSQTFINRRFKYTHGYGMTLTTVNEFTEQGLPNLLVKDIPPKSEYPELTVERPELYYGELSESPVYVNTSEKEFDYPKGEENVYVRYPGKGGVRISNLWRKFLYGWKFDRTSFFLSSYPKKDSRIMFHRQISDRVKSLAPFLKFDDDPYIVLANGKMYWIIDAYTTSRYYPYSEPFQSLERIEYKQGNATRIMNRQTLPQLDGINYIRNSVKTVVDAFNGKVTFYIYEEDDPVIQVWSKIFPDLFHKKKDMPEALQKHVRYPLDMLLSQGLVYAKYHMNDPAVFYNQEDLWIRATEKYYNQLQPVEPYYVMWEPPETDDSEFTLILPFTPKNRQVLIGWIAGMCDGENYGRFLAYKFPKDKRVLGTQQVETKIDQDSYLSGQLSLWDQRGSNVIRGNVLAIPIDDTILYVEPIYLRAETAAYPELRLVVLMHNDKLSYAESFSEALEGLLGEKPAKQPVEEAVKMKGRTVEQLIQNANDAFENYLDAVGNKKFEDAGRELNNLQNALQRLKQQMKETPQNENE